MGASTSWCGGNSRAGAGLRGGDDAAAAAATTAAAADACLRFFARRSASASESRAFALALTLGFLAAGAMTLIARRHIAGQTGDVCGAAQQMCEIAFLVALCASPSLQAAP